MQRSRISWIRFALFLFASTVAVLVSERGDARTLPPRAMRAGRCDIKIDCPNYKVIINGRTAGQIVCGRQTAASFRHGRIARNITPASGAILPRGFPMIATTPPLCRNCFIHPKKRVGPGASSLGCVGMDETAWSKIRQCGGSAFTIVPNPNARRPKAGFKRHRAIN